MRTGRLLLAAVLVSRGAVAGDAPRPELKVMLAPARAAQGGVVEVIATSPSPLASLFLVDGERRVPLAPDGGGSRFVGLYGVDFEAAPGQRKLLLEGRDGARDGAAPPLGGAPPGRACRSRGTPVASGPAGARTGRPADAGLESQPLSVSRGFTSMFTPGIRPGPYEMLSEASACEHLPDPSRCL